jgi:hypothetical protein
MKPKMQAFRERQAALGNKPRTLYMTDTEFETIKKVLAKIRAQGGIVNPNKANPDPIPVPEATQQAPVLVSNPVAEAEFTNADVIAMLDETATNLKIELPKADPEPVEVEPKDEYLVKLEEMALAFKAEGLSLDPEQEAIIAQIAKTDPGMAYARRAFAEDGARSYAKAMSKVEVKTEEIKPPTPEEQAELLALIEEVRLEYNSGGGIFKGEAKLTMPLEDQLEAFYNPIPA